MKNLHVVENIELFLAGRDPNRYDIVVRYWDDDSYSSDEYTEAFNAVNRYNNLKHWEVDGLSLFVWDAEEQKYHLFLGEKPEGLL